MPVATTSLGSVWGRYETVSVTFIAAALGSSGGGFLSSDHRNGQISLVFALIGVPVSIGAIVNFVRQWRRPTKDPRVILGDLDSYAKTLRDDMRTGLRSELQLFDRGAPLPMSWDVPRIDSFDRNIDKELRAVQDDVAQSDYYSSQAGDPGSVEVGAKNVSALVLYRVFESQRRRPLVVLGELGAGKSTVLQHFAVNLLNEWDEGPKLPVPVFVSVSSWDPTKQKLVEWLAQELARSHTYLEDPASAKRGSRTAIEALLDDDRILPILDGLDEMSERFRHTAIAGINFALAKRGQTLVISCITTVYQQLAERNGDQAPCRIEGAAGIELCPPRKQDIRTYLGQDKLTWPDISERWADILAKHGDPSPVGQVFRTPLMVDLGRKIFNPTDQPESREVASPSILLDPNKFATPAAIEGYLFSRFIPASYAVKEPTENGRNKPHRGDNSQDLRHYESTDAERWLTFLAGRFTDEPPPASDDDGGQSYSEEKVHDVSWWRLETFVRPPLAGLGVGLICGVACGIAAYLGSRVGTGFGMGLGVGSLLALVVGHLLRRRLYGYRYATTPAGERVDPIDEPTLRTFSDRLSRFVRIRPGEAGPAAGLAAGLAGGVLGGLAAGLLAALGFGDARGAASGVAVGLGVGLAVGPNTGFRSGFVGCFCGGLLGGLIPGVGHGAPAAILNGLGVGIGAGLTVHLAPKPEPAQRLSWNKVGSLGGLAAGIALGLVAWRVLGSWVGILAGALAAALCAAVSGLFGTVEEMEKGRHLVTADEANGPDELLARDRRHFRQIVMAAGGATGLVTLLIVGVEAAVDKHVKATLSFVVANGMATGLAVGLSCGLVLAMVQAAWGRSVLARLWLATTGRLPFDLMRFLADAHRRRVLRTQGADYKFRHGELQKYLARNFWDDEKKGKMPQSKRKPDANVDLNGIPASLAQS